MTASPGPATPAPAPDDAAATPPERLDLICTERPSRAVAFGERDQVSYDECAPKEAARIGSANAEVAADLATWTGVTRIVARELKDIRQPVRIKGRSGIQQHRVDNFNMYLYLRHNFKGELAEASAQLRAIEKLRKMKGAA